MIGKHTLTFEDPNFKEPPAEMASKLAPPAPPPAAAGGLPVATPVAEPAPAAAAPAAVAEGPRLRRRTGHTTAVERTARYEQAREQKLLTYVGVGAGVFVFILLVLILIPTGGESPAVKTSREAYDKGLALYQARQYDQARIALDRVPAEPRDIKAKALGLLRQIDEDQKRMGSAAGEEEKKAFDALYDFCEPNRANPNKFEAMHGMCQSFKEKYPKSQFMGKVDEFLAVASAGKKATVKNDLAEGEKLAQEDAKKNDYATAVRRLKDLMTRHKDDAETHQRLSNLLGEVQDKAKAYSRAESQKAGELLARGKKDEAQVVYLALIASMGDGTVPELEDYANIAKTALQGLK
jgi:hypothetical protein